MAKKPAASSAHEIAHLQADERMIPPPKAFAARARIRSTTDAKALAKAAREYPEDFWRGASLRLAWDKPYTSVFRGGFSKPEWFGGGKLNAAANCLDKHLGTAREHKAALVWEGEDGAVRTLTYRQLYELTGRTANALKSLGVKKGDRIGIYMGLVPEAVAAMLACARLGAIHTVVFGGFSADSLADRLNDCGCTVLITQDEGWRRGERVPLKANADAALAKAPGVRHCLVVKRTGAAVPKTAGRDRDFDETIRAQSPECKPASCNSEDPLFILYTSGSTGKPKGILHTTAGYLLWASLTTSWVFDLKDSDLYWCTADIGWVTGHSYVVYGPLENGATVFLYEGAPNYPDWSRFWRMIERHRISILYTAPTAIRAFMRAGDEFVARHDLSSLRLLGSVGEPINPAAWRWYHQTVGGGRCPIVDTWWQTETGGILMSPLPGVTPLKPGSCTQPLPGIEPGIFDRHGNEVKNGGGLLAIKKPWPGMLRGIWGDPARLKKQYYADLPGMYFTGDGARKDKDGYFWVMGRVDDVINVAGHRLSTAEVESALVSHPKVAEAAVVGRPDELKGTAIVAFVSLKAGVQRAPALEDELKAHVAAKIGALARPETLRFAEGLPKTRSGKIMRRLLRELAAGDSPRGDTSTLEDFSVLEKLRAEDEE